MDAKDFKKYVDMIGDGRYLEAELFREKDIPDLLIKHVWLNGDESDEKKFYSLENNMLWFSSITKLNDPYEFKGMIVNEKAFKDAGYPDDYIDKFRDFLKMEDYGVVCLSSREIDYLPMWAYYTNNYQGYCVQYEVVNKACIHRVMYESNRIPIASLFFQLLNALQDAFTKGDTTSDECKRIATIIRQNLYIKGKDWEHEQEYRIAMPITNDIGENLVISQFGLKVKRIIAGVNCSPNHLARLNDISNKMGCGNIYTTHLSETKYGIDIKQFSGTM